MFNSVQEEKQKNEGKKTDEPKNLALHSKNECKLALNSHLRFTSGHLKV